MPEKFSLALTGGKRIAPISSTNGIKRSHAALRADDDEDDQHSGAAHTVSHFDRAAGGAIDEADKSRDQGPLIIAAQANRDWKEAQGGRRKRQRHGLPEGGSQTQNVSAQVAREAELEVAKPGFGLSVSKRKDGDDEKSEEPVVGNGHGTNAGTEGSQQLPMELGEEMSVQPKTDDDRALDALLGKTPKSTLVLPAATVTEEEAFERDFHSAPDMATLEDYARVPVEQFGAALLRGMGWKEGQGIGSQRGVKVVKVKVPERRPALLGIGAKEEAAVAQEMGVWGKAAKRGGEVKVYNPVLLRDKKTGETFTEEEVVRRKEEDERRAFEEEFERQEREKEEKRRRRDRPRDGERDGDGRRRRGEDGDRSREDRRDGDRRPEKQRRRDYDRDDESYRRKEKERRRREREHEDSDHHRERADRHDSGREKHRERERERDRRR
ncbi:DNA primase large subunit Spp2 [Friedmanniomyces endolithicus]|uniref:Pre-mRNA-splicing factor n=1 Tax=Friedmanniomyces endolithicus TaxID=329885 RepID=A0A4U0UU26_9PEZI|nr:DNA primase large subunit Spp2 [Friedmanniomyces endolithicus]KAK0924347.1 DNA primase large subunit Spp2 [Friedmanniomyces endolithicus]KAK0953972.1 DNA primase large subunit Spp2 [Friedmanniomyces endolithicus]KAK0982168.1 DNA primase large subunit Spp2 [Friedmanniomyces endolithicus]KAK1053140.1 DNA primase large subunit Spp2 [Friedmanniomyces endolithicus]